MNPIFPGQISGGKLLLDNRIRFQGHVESLEGKRIDLVLKEHREKRSDQQNKYYWAVVVKLIADHCGYSPEELHDALKIKFLGGNPDEHGLRRVLSTAKLTTDEFTQYTNRIVQWAAIELGVYIPDPGQVDYNGLEAMAG